MIHKHRKTKAGMIGVIYSNQRYNSTTRHHPEPDYTLQELREWCFSQKIFHELYNAWKNSGYEKDLAPSIDRINSKEPYTFQNIQIMTWDANNRKEWDKRNRAVQQFTLTGELVAEYISIAEASRQTGIYRTLINNCCANGRSKTAGGFVWKHKFLNK